MNYMVIGCSFVMGLLVAMFLEKYIYSKKKAKIKELEVELFSEDEEKD